MIALHESQGVVDLVGDAGGELPDGRQLFPADHQGLRFLELLVGFGELQVHLHPRLLVSDAVGDVRHCRVDEAVSAAGVADESRTLQSEDRLTISPGEDDLEVPDGPVFHQELHEHAAVPRVRPELFLHPADHLVHRVEAEELDPGPVDLRDPACTIHRHDHVLRFADEGTQLRLAGAEGFFEAPQLLIHSLVGRSRIDR